MKNYFLAILLTPLIGMAQAQKDTAYSPYILKANVISPVDIFSFPTIQMAIERKLKNNFSISAEAGVQLYDLAKGYSYDTAFVPAQGFKANVEIRYFELFRQLRPAGRKDKQTKADPYVGINFFYRQNKFNQSVEYRKPNEDSVLTDDFWGVKKVGGFNLVIGIQKSKGRFVFDTYCGIGLLYRQATNNNREYNYPTDTLGRPGDLTVSEVQKGGNLSENNGVKGNFNLGIRLGMILGKRQKKN